MAIKHSVPMATLFSSPHPLDFNKLVIFSSKNVTQGHEHDLTYLNACWIMQISIIGKYRERTLKVAREALNIGKSGTQNIAMVSKMLGLYCGAPLI